MGANYSEQPKHQGGKRSTGKQLTFAISLVTSTVQQHKYYPSPSLGPPVEDKGLSKYTDTSMSSSINTPHCRLTP